MTDLICESATAPQDRSGCRFDQVAAELFPNFSRSRIQSWIKAGNLTVNGRLVKPNTKLVGGEKIDLSVQVLPEGEWVPEDIAFDVLFADEAVIVLNKPPGLVVHPAAGDLIGGVALLSLPHQWRALLCDDGEGRISRPVRPLGALEFLTFREVFP